MRYNTSLMVSFSVSRRFCAAAAFFLFLCASCSNDSSVTFFLAGGEQGDYTPLIALSKDAKQASAEGEAVFLFAFSPEAAPILDAEALEVTAEIASTSDDSEATAADVFLAFLTEDDFERLPQDGKPKLKGDALKLQQYNRRKDQNSDLASLLGARSCLTECSSNVSIRIAAPQNKRVAGFALLVLAGEGARSSIVSASVKTVSCGFLSDEAGKITWAGFPAEGGSFSGAATPATLPAVAVPEGHSVSILFKPYEVEETDLNGGTASLIAAQKRAVFRARSSGKEFGMRVPPSGGISLFQPCLLGGDAGEVAAVSGGELVQGIFTEPAFPQDEDDAEVASLFSAPHLEPIAADPHGIIEWPQDAWRRPNREVFKWDRFPSILVFDTADYDVQNRYFRRLAFFAEKQGYRGRLLTDAELAGRHAYNAHDYSAETLAEFFSLAALSDFPLLDEELELRGILLNSDVIRSSGEGAFDAGEGAVLSISRSSPTYLRYSFMAHEGFHALFFIDEDFRRKVAEVYEATDSRATAFLRGYFRLVDGLGYDTSNSYLMQNEFMGYLLQNRYDAVRNYFAVNIAERYLRYGGDERLATYIMETRAADFASAADELSAYTFSRWGILGGRVGLQFWDD